jgi:hypothetical protein
MTHPLYTPSTARSPKVISFEPLQRGADAAEAAIRAAEDQLVAAMKAEEGRAALYAKRDQGPRCPEFLELVSNTNTHAARTRTRTHEAIRPSLHQILVHVATETYRHAGHADIVRELIDGAVGLRLGNDNMAPGDEAW